MKYAGLLPAAAVAPGAVLAVSAGAEKAATSMQLTRRDFQSLLDQQFSVVADDAKARVEHRLRLLALSDVPHCRNPNLSFTATFEVVSGTGVEQSVWQLSHPVLGAHAVFLSPNDGEGLLVEAVFNRG
jgi:hypothetical protein